MITIPFKDICSILQNINRYQDTDFSIYDTSPPIEGGIFLGKLRNCLASGKVRELSDQYRFQNTTVTDIQIKGIFKQRIEITIQV